MDTNRKGTITETKAILKLLELGYNIYTPYGDGSKCDMIIQNIDGVLLKVQCKTSRISENNEVFSAYSTARTRSVEGNKKKVLYTKKDIDLFCTFDLENNMYLIPIEKINTNQPRLKIYKEYIIK